ncbi:MAG: adenylyltransferase/cytidyltransferase family protein [Candidatus Thalassarchaeaceae archaeon]
MSDLPLEPLPPEQPPESGVVVLGRFQPVHKGHALMIRAADDWRSANASDKGLIIAIGSSNQPPSIRNPWSSEERAAMLRAWLASAGIEAKIVAIPDIEDPPELGLPCREVPWKCRVHLHHRCRDSRALRVIWVAGDNG